MYVCVCNAVAKREVHLAILDGAHTVAAVAIACGAGTDCGACHAMIEDMVEDHCNRDCSLCTVRSRCDRAA